MKPTYELRTYLVALALPRLFRHPFSRSLSHSRRTRLRLAIITAPDIYRHGIRARRLISGSRLPRAPFLLLSALPPFLSASFFSSFLFPLSLSLSPSFSVSPQVYMKLTGRTPHFALLETGHAVPPKFKLIAQLAAAGNSLGTRAKLCAWNIRWGWFLIRDGEIWKCFRCRRGVHVYYPS